VRIAVDVSSAAKPDPTGIGRYACELVRALAPLLAPEDRLRLVVKPARWKERRHVLALAAIPRIEAPRFRTGALPAIFVRKDEIFHSTGVSLPRGIRGLRVVTVHDTNTMDDERLASARWVAERSAKTRAVVARADLVLTVSAFVRERVLHHFPEIGPERVRVTHHGADHATGGAAALSPEPAAGDADALARLGLAGRPYVLSVGRVERRKNPEGLVRGFARAAAARGHALVFAGPRGDSDVERALEETGIAERVRFLGRFDDRDLGALYRGAAAFALPSRYEGFGIPLIEALACGTPSLAGDRTSLPEVAGDAALLVDPEDPDAIARALDRLLADEALRRDLRTRGPARARRFTWRACAEATLAAYRDLAAIGRRR
jgi:glycosyltransferase involved in cell wall biosynthesis